MNQQTIEDEIRAVWIWRCASTIALLVHTRLIRGIDISSTT
jgi:hypothetical protein